MSPQADHLGIHQVNPRVCHLGSPRVCHLGSQVWFLQDSLLACQLGIRQEARPGYLVASRVPNPRVYRLALRVLNRRASRPLNLPVNPLVYRQQHHPPILLVNRQVSPRGNHQVFQRLYQRVDRLILPQVSQAPYPVVLLALCLATTQVVCLHLNQRGFLVRSHRRYHRLNQH